ncbi:MAG: hypothetical protein M0Q94_13015 [Candidatus Cloacimonetes bacterium]|nr:hypothetical protein [Candidatus Cloacimonadota bacterium]
MKKAFKVLLLAVLILAIGSFAFANGSSEKAAPAEAERSSKPVTLTLWNSSQTMVDW